MKIWAIINPPPIAYDTAYLLGRVISRADRVSVTKFESLPQILRDAPTDFQVVFNRTISSDPLIIEGIEKLALERGARLVNSAKATLRASDKRTYLEDYKGMTPDTWVLDSLSELHALHKDVRFELVVKNPFGKFGKEVVRFDGNENSPFVREVIDGCRGSGFVAQRYCQGFSKGDKRVIVHRRSNGDFDIVAWYLRVPAEGNWISNLSAGGKILSSALSKEEAEFCREIASKSGLDYVGLDIGRQDGRTLLIETNAYTGGHMDFDALHQHLSSGDDFAKFLCEMVEY